MPTPAMQMPMPMPMPNYMPITADGKRMANARQQHGKRNAMAIAWQVWRTHGNCVANAWQTHGNCMANAWQSMATAWQLHGKRMAIA
jgi:macrodomain Ter protein organizer (MatP/YcbG family)